jgi:hypothetical protein
VSRSKNGREIVDGVYRDLERLYPPLKIANGKIEIESAGDMPQKLYTTIVNGIAALEKTVAQLPTPQPPSKRMKNWPKFEDPDA